MVSYDRRGRGESGDTAPFAVEREVEDLAAVIGAVGGEASLYGISSGGALALRAAASGLPVRRVAVYEPPYAEYEDGVEQCAAYTERLTRGARARTGAGTPLELFLRLDRAGRGDDPGRPPVPDVGRHGGARAHASRTTPTCWATAGFPGPCWPRRRTRVLVVDGGASPAWLREAARAVAEALPQGTYRTLDGQTHEVAPHALAPVLAEFFAGVTPPRGGCLRGGRLSRRLRRVTPTPAVARAVVAIVAEPTTRVPSYSTIAWPGATPRTGSVKVTSQLAVDQLGA